MRNTPIDCLANLSNTHLGGPSLSEGAVGPLIEGGEDGMNMVNGNARSRSIRLGICSLIVSVASVALPNAWLPTVFDPGAAFALTPAAGWETQHANNFEAAQENLRRNERAYENGEYGDNFFSDASLIELAENQGVAEAAFLENEDGITGAIQAGTCFPGPG